MVEFESFKCEMSGGIETNNLFRGEMMNGAL